MLSAFLGGLGVCLGLAADAQTSQQQRVFRAGTIFVSVDAYPRKDDKIVDNLTKADFEILEDGKPQTVEEFEFIRVSPITPDDERRDPTSVEDGNRQAADPHNRVFVVYLDTFNTSVFGAHHAREPIIQFLSRAVGPKDLFAVVTPELPATGITFARRTETLEAELRKYWAWSEGQDRGVIARSEYESKLLFCDPSGILVRSHRQRLTLESVEQMIARLGTLRDERKNILFVSEGWALPRGRLGVANSPVPRIPTVGTGPGGRLGIGGNMSGYTDGAWCDSQVATLAAIDYEQRFRNLTSMATRANVAFYSIDVGGLKTGQVPASMAPPTGMKSSEIPAWQEQYRAAMVGKLEMLHDLATATDGKAIVNTNDLTGAVRKIADDLSAFYLLGYYSSNSAADGKFRRIEVKVKQPGVKVSARRGYLGPTEAIRKAELEAASRPAYVPTAVDKEMSRLSRLGTDARLFSSAVVTPTGLDVVVELASSEFSSGRWTNGASVKLDVLSKDEGGKPHAAEGRLDAGSRSVLIKVPLAGSPPGGWRVRTRVEGGGESLSDEIEIANASSIIGEPTVFRANPGPRAPLRPVADFKFFRTERVHVEWIIAKPLDDRVGRLLTRKGDPLAVPVALSERMDGDRLVLTADLVLAPLADGDYAIEVTGSAGGEKFQRLLAFRVVR